MIVVLALVLAASWALTQPKMYQSTASGLVLVVGSEDLGSALVGDNLSKSKATAYSSIAKSRTVASEVKRTLDVPVSESTLLQRVSVSVPTGTAEIRIAAVAPSPDEAQRLAEVWMESLARQVRDIELTGVTDSEASPSVRIETLGLPTLPTSPYSPNVQLAVLIGAVLGIALGAAYAILRQHLDRRIRSTTIVEGMGCSVVGTIPQDERLKKGRAVVSGPTLELANDKHGHAFAEALRELRINLSYVDVDNPPGSIVVTSSVAAEGKSSVAANLAAAIAATGKRTVLIDADLRRSVQSIIFDLPGGAGLSDVLAGTAYVEDVLMPYGPIPELEILAAGRMPPNPAELLGTQAMVRLIDTLVADHVVIIDAPPLLPVTDALVLSTLADGMLVTVRAGKTTVDEFGKSLENLRRVGARVLGVILNQVPTKGIGSAQYGYYGQYYSSSSDAGAGKKSARRNAKKTRSASAEPATAVPHVDDEFDAQLHGLRHARRLRN